MSGFTKHMYEKDVVEIEKQLSAYVKELSVILPLDYDFNSLVELIEEFYPYEFRVIKEKYEEYCILDRKIIKMKGKARFNMQSPLKILENLPITKDILSDVYRQKYRQEFDLEVYECKKEAIVRNRVPRIKKKKDKIDKAIAKTQQMEPQFLDKLMGLYERKNTTQMDRVYIMLELQKYYCPKVIKFFKKRAHSELNFQLREMAVLFLHSMGHYAVLRKQKYMRVHTKNRKKKKNLKQEYAKQKFNIKAIPNELEYRINNNAMEQRLKAYDYFVSHSSKDYENVQKLIYELNNKRKNVYCDWINDTDYLKRKLVCDATLMVIRKRIEQSKAIVWVESQESVNSIWVKYELNYAQRLNKPIYCINRDDVEDLSRMYKLSDYWFFDEKYEEVKLY